MQETNYEENQPNSRQYMSNMTSSHLPCNIEAEQAILGAILANNDIFEDVSQIINSEHFYDAVHRSLFELISDRINRNSTTSHVALAPYVESIPGLSDLGGADYLFSLAESAVSIHASRDFAEDIFDLWRRRRLIEFGKEIADKAKSFDTMSPVSEIIEDSEKRLYELNTVKGMATGFKNFTFCLNEVLETAKSALVNPTGVAGLSTGFNEIDKKLGGLQPSDLIIVAGRPSMGKTALATNIAVNVAKNYNKYGSQSEALGHVGFFSLEMSTLQLAARITSERSQITATQLRKGDIHKGDFQRLADSIEYFQSLPIHIDDAGSLNIAQLSTRARRLKRTKGLDLLVVDYLQLVNAVNRHNSVVHEVSEISRGLKAIAKDLQIPVIAVSQLSRQVESRENRRPQLSDLRDSGSIEQDADVVLFVFREAYYLEREKPSEDQNGKMAQWQEKMEECSRKAEIIIAKHRQGGIGKVELSFEPQFTLFGNLAQEGYEEIRARSSDFSN